MIRRAGSSPKQRLYPKTKSFLPRLDALERRDAPGMALGLLGVPWLGPLATFLELTSTTADVSLVDSHQISRSGASNTAPTIEAGNVSFQPLSSLISAEAPGSPAIQGHGLQSNDLNAAPFGTSSGVVHLGPGSLPTSSVSTSIPASVNSQMGTTISLPSAVAGQFVTQQNYPTGIPAPDVVNPTLASLVLSRRTLPTAHRKASAPTSVQNPPTNQQILDQFGQLPVTFEVNQGQFDSSIRYVGRAPDYTLLLNNNSATMILANVRRPDGIITGTALRSQVVGANPNAQIVGQDLQPGISNYFLGNDPTKWHTNVPNYGKVTYHNILAGVDEVFYGKGGKPEYDFVVAPGSNPGRIQMDIAGADSLSIDSSGNLVMHTTNNGDVIEAAPIIYQDADGMRQAISGGFQLEGGSRVGFSLGAYDHTKALVIDPSLSWSTYLGGHGGPGIHTGLEEGFGVVGRTVSSTLNAYVAGETDSTNFPTTTGAFQTGLATTFDAFITKFSAEPTSSNKTLVYSTYIGGRGDEYFGGGDPFRGILAVDSSGNAYITGTTASDNYPTTTNAYQTATSGGVYDGFVTKLNSSGTQLLYSSYLGATGSDFGESYPYGIAIDDNGDAYVTGDTYTSSFPTTSGAYQTTLSGTQGNAFVTKLDTTQSGSASLIYSTYLGGSGGSEGLAIAIDSGGKAYLTGSAGQNFPTTTNAFQTDYTKGYAFLSKINPAGGGSSDLLYSSYFGGSAGTGSDYGYAIAVKTISTNTFTYITGTTLSTDFPTTSGAYQTTGGGLNSSAFVSKFNLALSGSSSLIYSTYLGTGTDGGYGVAVDSSGNIFVDGFTTSNVFPTTSGAYQTTYNGGAYDAFLSKINPAGGGASDLVYSTYFGGSNDDIANAISLDGNGGVYIAGETNSTDFPTLYPYQSTAPGDGDAFVAKFSF